MSYDVEIAKLLKERNNKSIETAIIGIVKSVSPLIVSTDNDSIFLNKNHLYITDTASNKSLNINDEVLLLPSNQTYFIIDKVRKVE